MKSLWKPRLLNTYLSVEVPKLRLIATIHTRGEEVDDIEIRNKIHVIGVSEYGEEKR